MMIILCTLNSPVLIPSFVNNDHISIMLDSYKIQRAEYSNRLELEQSKAI